MISLIAPLLFLQKGVASNTIQFLQYFLILFGVLAALAITHIQNSIRSGILKILFIFIVIIFSIPTQLGLLYDFYHKPPLAKITSGEIQALDFLKANSNINSIILTPPYSKYLNLKMATPDIWTWSDTSYVSAFTQRRTYLTDTEQVDIMGYNYQERLEFQKLIFESDETEKTDKFFLVQIEQKLKLNKIDYIYFPKRLRPKINLSIFGSKIFDNSQIEIWRI